MLVSGEQFEGCLAGSVAQAPRPRCPGRPCVAGQAASFLGGRGYWLGSPLVFSLVLYCQGLWESQKPTHMSGLPMAIFPFGAISAPWPQTRVLSRSLGRVRTLATVDSCIWFASWPLGRCSRIVNRVLHSASVPMALLFEPIIRLSFQWPCIVRRPGHCRGQANPKPDARIGSDMPAVHVREHLYGPMYQSTFGPSLLRLVLGVRMPNFTAGFPCETEGRRRDS